MICKECSHCGLCSGDGTGPEDLQVQIKNEALWKATCDSSLPSNQVGIAFDLGTTTIALRLLCLSTGDEIVSFGEANRQIELGSDVVSRISLALTDEGFDTLHDLVVKQMSSMIERAMLLCQAKFSSARRGRAELRGIAVAGNTTMQSLLAGVSVSSLATFPFTVTSSFGDEIPAEKIFGGLPFFSKNCSVYFAPVVSAYVGGDIVSAMVATGFLAEDGKTRYLADIGTNCEMCVRDGDGGKITCTSTSAGPAFEGFGIECGAPAGKGSIVNVNIEESEIRCRVIGGGPAVNISGTGLVSAVSEFLDTKLIARDGMMDSGREKIFLADGVYLTQMDIRNFQLAKGSVFCGLKILSGGVRKKSRVELYLAGGFGTKIDVEEARAVRMIPEELCGNVFAVGNASLAGISMLLLDGELRKAARVLASNCVALDLSQEPSFQGEFINSLNF